MRGAWLRPNIWPLNEAVDKPSLNQIDIHSLGECQHRFGFNILCD